MNKIKDFSDEKKVTFDDVLAIIDNVCEDKIRSIISASDGNIHEIARQLYANKFGSIAFYPWSENGFNQDDPATYCTGLEIETTFYFNEGEIDGIKLNGSRLVTIWMSETGFIHRIQMDGGEFVSLGHPNSPLYISKLKERYKANPDLFVASDFLEIDSQRGA